MLCLTTEESLRHNLIFVQMMNLERRILNRGCPRSNAVSRWQTELGTQPRGATLVLLGRQTAIAFTGARVLP